MPSVPSGDRNGGPVAGGPDVVVIPQQLDLVAAIEARDAGMQDALDHARGRYLNELERAIAQLADSGRTFCADDVRELAGDPPQDTSPNVVGAIVNAAARSGLIVLVGYTHSARVVGHGNLVRCWRGRAA